MKKVKSNKKIIILATMMTAMTLFAACGKEQVIEPSVETTTNETDVSDSEAVTDTVVDDDASGDSEMLEDNEANNREIDDEAKQIIANAESYNTTDKIFNSADFFANPEQFFLSEDDAQAYGLIVDDLNQKTNSAQFQVSKFYQNVGMIFEEDSEFCKIVNAYFCKLELSNLENRDNNKAYEHLFNWTGKNFADNTEIYFGSVFPYVPYYVRTGLYEDKIMTMSGVFAEMESTTVAETIFKDIPDYEWWTCMEYVPGFHDFLSLGIVYDNFNIKDNELVFSSPIEVDYNVEEMYFDYYSGRVYSSYVIPFYDKTSDVYGVAWFGVDNNLITVSYR